MALTERSRNALYTGLTEIIHEEAVSEMLSYFPARDVEEPVTKEFLRAEMAELRAEIAEMRAEMVTRAEFRAECADIRGQLRWMFATMLTMTGLIIAAMALLT